MTELEQAIDSFAVFPKQISPEEWRLVLEAARVVADIERLPKPWAIRTDIAHPKASGVDVYIVRSGDIEYSHSKLSTALRATLEKVGG